MSTELSARPRQGRSRTGTAAVAMAAMAATALLTACAGRSDVPSNSAGGAGSTGAPGATGTAAASSGTAAKGAATPVGTAAAAAAAVVPAKMVKASGGTTVAASKLAQQIAAAARRQKFVTFSVMSRGREDTRGDGQASGTAGTLRSKISGMSAGQPVQMVMTGTAVYLAVPGASMPKPWVEIQVDPKSPKTNAYLASFSSLGAASDVPTLATRIAQLGNFHAMAKEKVDGVQTTKYVANPPVSKMDTLVPVSLQGLQPSKFAKVKVAVTLWVDGSGLLQRSSFVFEVPGESPTQTLVTYGKWGKPISISVPAASQVTVLPTSPAK